MMPSSFAARAVTVATQRLATARPAVGATTGHSPPRPASRPLRTSTWGSLALTVLELVCRRSGPDAPAAWVAAREVSHVQGHQGRFDEAIGLARTAEAGLRRVLDAEDVQAVECG